MKDYEITRITYFLSQADYIDEVDKRQLIVRICEEMRYGGISAEESSSRQHRAKFPN